MLLNDKVDVSVCDGCSNWRICKFSEDVKRAEAEYKQLRENANWPECIKATLDCKYKQYVSNSLNIRYDAVKTVTNSSGEPCIYNGTTTCNIVE